MLDFRSWAGLAVSSPKLRLMMGGILMAEPARPKSLPFGSPHANAQSANQWDGEQLDPPPTLDSKTILKVRQWHHRHQFHVNLAKQETDASQFRGGRMSMSSWSGPRVGFKGSGLWDSVSCHVELSLPAHLGSRGHIGLPPRCLFTAFEQTLPKHQITMGHSFLLDCPARPHRKQR